jgi:hypothetical protein
MSGEPVKEGGELLKIAMKYDKAGKKGDADKQLQAALAYANVQRLFAQALRGTRFAHLATALALARSPSAHASHGSSQMKQRKVALPRPSRRSKKK